MASHIKNDFPILQQKIHGHPLAYLDNGATTQIPQAVIDAYTTYYSTINANIRRGIHALSEKSDHHYEATRALVAEFIHAPSPEHIIFTSGATESINLVAQSYGNQYLTAGDEIILSTMEHHSNLLPWQRVAKEKGAILKYVTLHQDGQLDMDMFKASITKNTKIIALTHVSNVTGVINPIQSICREAKKRGIITVIDGTQAIPHFPVDMQSLECDFYAFSAHKMYGPKGVGILFGRTELLETMPAYHLGGGIITTVKATQATYQDAPYRFEAGTPNIAGIYALKACINYLNTIGYKTIQFHEKALYQYTAEALKTIKGLKIYGDIQNKAPVFAFTIDQIHPHDIATLVDAKGVALRSGMHCTTLLHDFFNIPATTRGSIAIYNDQQDVDQCIDALIKAVKMMRRT